MSDSTATPPLDEQVRHRVADRVAWITLDRPEVGNAISGGQRDRVIELLAEASARLDVGTVVLTATGKAFCTGADLRAAPSTGPARPEGAPDRAVGDVSRVLREGAQRLISAVLDCEKPVIAAVNGTAAGIGAHLAWASDLVIAADSARFIEAFVRRGIVPDGGGAYLLPRLIGLHKARELLYFGDDLSAPDAERLGLVNLVVPADDLEKTATAWATRLASGRPARSRSQVAGEPVARHRPGGLVRRRGHWPRNWRWAATTPTRASTPSRNAASRSFAAGSPAAPPAFAGSRRSTGPRRGQVRTSTT